MTSSSNPEMATSEITHPPAMRKAGIMLLPVKPTKNVAKNGIAPECGKRNQQ